MLLTISRSIALLRTKYISYTQPSCIPKYFPLTGYKCRLFRRTSQTEVSLTLYLCSPLYSAFSTFFRFLPTYLYTLNSSLNLLFNHLLRHHKIFVPLHLEFNTFAPHESLPQVLGMSTHSHKMVISCYYRHKMTISCYYRHLPQVRTLFYLL